MAEHGWASRHSVIEIVNDDMPFLVDSTTMEINRQGLTLHLIVHPIFAVERDADGRLASIRPPRREAPRRGARIVDARRGRSARSTRSSAPTLVAGIERVLADVRAAVDDWKPMVARLHEADRRARRRRRRRVPAGAGGGEPRLPAMAGRRTTSRCSATAQHDLVAEDGEDALRLVPGSGLGVLRESAARARPSASFAALPPRGARAGARSRRRC